MHFFIHLSFFCKKEHFKRYTVCRMSLCLFLKLPRLLHPENSHNSTCGFRCLYFLFWCICGCATFALMLGLFFISWICHKFTFVTGAAALVLVRFSKINRMKGFCLVFLQNRGGWCISIYVLVRIQSPRDSSKKCKCDTHVCMKILFWIQW
jgi:hypothetical protein